MTMKFKNLNLVTRTLQDGGYIAEYQNYKGSGIRGALAGTALHNKDEKCVLTDCRKEFIHLKKEKLIQPVEWEEGPYSGTEWRWKDGANH